MAQESNDLGKLTSAAVLEDLAKLQRYRDKVVASQGTAAFAARRRALEDELMRRGVPLPEIGPDAPAQPCRLIPFGDHVVVRPHAADDITPGGIIVVETAKEKPMQGEVVAVGPGRTEPGVGTIVPACVVGDVVLFGRYAGIEVTLDEEKILVLREDDLLGKIAEMAS